MPCLKIRLRCLYHPGNDGPHDRVDFSFHNLEIPYPDAYSMLSTMPTQEQRQPAVELCLGIYSPFYLGTPALVYSIGAAWPGSRPSSPRKVLFFPAL